MQRTALAAHVRNLDRDVKLVVGLLLSVRRARRLVVRDVIEQRALRRVVAVAGERDAPPGAAVRDALRERDGERTGRDHERRPLKTPLSGPHGARALDADVLGARRRAVERERARTRRVAAVASVTWLLDASSDARTPDTVCERADASGARRLGRTEALRVHVGFTASWRSLMSLRAKAGQLHTNIAYGATPSVGPVGDPISSAFLSASDGGGGAAS